MRSPANLFSALSFEVLQARDASPEPFPMGYLRQRLEVYLSNAPARVGHLRIAATFIEPFDQRANSYDGPIGYIVVALPQLGNCARNFGIPTKFRAADTVTGIRLAINEQAQSIADWIFEAATKEPLQCPR